MSVTVYICVCKNIIVCGCFVVSIPVITPTVIIPTSSTPTGWLDQTVHGACVETERSGVCGAYMCVCISPFDSNDKLLVFG